MRLSSFVVALSLLGLPAACGKQDSAKQEPANQGSAPKGASDGAITGAPVVKKPVDKTPLPALERDAGGGSGKPLSSVAFGGLGIDAPTGIVLGPEGEIYVSGYFDGELDLGPAGKLVSTPPVPEKPGAEAGKKKTVPPDAYLARINPDGKTAWMKSWGDKRDDVAKGIAINGDTIVVVGNFLDRLDLEKPADPSEPSKNPASGSDDMYAVAFDRGGKVQWIWTLGGIDSDGANAVAAAPDGGFYVGGSFWKTIKIADTEVKSQGKSDALLVKLSKTGTVEWWKQFGGPDEDTIMFLRSDARGNVYAQGHFQYKASWGGEPLLAPGGSANDVVLAKYDANGDHQWSKRFGSAFDDVAGGLAVDPAGNVTIVGSYDREVSFGEGDQHLSAGEADIYIARFDTTGKLAWAKTYGGDRADIGWGVAADAAGNTYMTGWFENTVDFGKTAIGLVTSKGNKDVFVVKHDAAGNVVWVQTWGDKDHDQGRAIAVDPKGGVVVAGIFRFTLGVVSPALESVRAEGDRIPKPDTFVVRLEK